MFTISLFCADLWKGDQYGRHGLYLWNTNSDQTAGYYSPYYAFLKVLTANGHAYAIFTLIHCIFKNLSFLIIYEFVCIVETFLKCMALYMSVKYNQVFGVDAANSLELYNLDSTDIIRLSSESAGNVALIPTHLQQLLQILIM